MIPIELKNHDDMILLRVKADGKLFRNEMRNMDLSVSGSEIQYIQPGSSLRGVVSNKNQTYKIYEIYINKNSLFSDGGTDLQIEVVPCNGKVAVYVADDFLQLFNNKSSATYTDII